jgi:hypothetical protein
MSAPKPEVKFVLEVYLERQSFPLCLIKHHAMKTYGKVEVYVAWNDSVIDK